MKVKTTGYRIAVSGGNVKCIQCKTRLSAGLPYLVPVSGVRVVRELKAKSLCVACLQDMTKKAEIIVEGSTSTVYDNYQRKRFLANFDKENDDG